MLDAVGAIRLGVGLLFGLFLGGLFFGGLWWTVRRISQASHPIAIYTGSMVLRALIVLLGFYLVHLFFDWLSLAASLVGFFIIRVVLLRFSLASVQSVGGKP